MVGFCGDRFRYVFYRMRCLFLGYFYFMELIDNFFFYYILFEYILNIFVYNVLKFDFVNCLIFDKIF